MAVRTHIRAPNLVSQTVLVFALFSLNGACAPAPTAPPADSWSLTPPTLVTAGESSSLERLDVRKIDPSQSMKGLTGFSKLPLDSHISFARADVGLDLHYRSQCDDVSHSGKAKTSESVLLASLLPPSRVHHALTNSASICSLEIVVFSQAGSSHGFKLKDFTLQPSAVETKRLAEASAVAVQSRLKVICGAWWAEEDLVATKTSLGFERRLESISSGPVDGVDQRKEIWNPACATFGIDRDGQEIYLGMSHPLKNSRQIDVQETIQLNHQRLYLTAKQTLGSWKLINTSKYPQVIRIDGLSSRVRVSVISAQGAFPKWHRPVLLDAQTSVAKSDAQGIKSVGGTIYVHLASEQFATVELKFMTQAFCLPGTMVPGQPAMRLQTEQALVFEQTVSAMDLTEFSSATEATLKALPQVNRRTLLHHAELTPNESNTQLTRLTDSPHAGGSNSLSNQASCMGGDIFGSYSRALPE